MRTHRSLQWIAWVIIGSRKRRAYGATSTQPVAHEVDVQAPHRVHIGLLQRDCPAIPPLAGARFRAPPARANAGPQQKCPAGEISVLILSWRTRFPRSRFLASRNEDTNFQRTKVLLWRLPFRGPHGDKWPASVVALAARPVFNDFPLTTGNRWHVFTVFNDFGSRAQVAFSGFPKCAH